MELFNKKYNKAEDYLRQANDNPQIFTSSDYAFYENKINGLKTSFQQEQDKGNNTDFNKLNELSTQLDAVISDLEKIIQKECEVL